jgi:integrase
LLAAEMCISNAKRLDLCFTVNEGRPAVLAGNTLAYYGKPALKRAKIVKHVTYHTFRHTFGTLLNANGENPKVVQELLRHASLKVTTDVHMQAVSAQKRQAQSKLVEMVMGKTAASV